MKKNLLFFFVAGLLFTATGSLKAQVLYSNLNEANFTGNLPGSAFTGLTTASLFDDVNVQDIPNGDSINVTSVQVAIYRPASAPAATFTLYYSTLDETGTGTAVDPSYFAIPATEVSSLQLPANGKTAVVSVLSFDNEGSTLFKIKAPTLEIVPGYKTFFVGLGYGSAGTNGWLIQNAGTEDSNTNISVLGNLASGGGGLWLYVPKKTREAIDLYSLSGTDTVWSPSTMSMAVSGTFTTSLPVKFISFNGVLQDNEAVLNWSTASELNNKGFEVQKSADGQNYTDLAFVSGNGTTQKISNYTYSDPKMISGDNYYRLKQIDLDGSFNYSSVIKLEFSNLAWSILGNPSTNSSVQLQLDKQHNVAVQIVSIAGNVIQTINKGNLGQGTYSIPLDFSHAASGMYIVRMIIDGQSSSKNIVK